MSQVLKSVVSALKVVESQIRCARYSFDGTLPLPEKANAFIADLYTIMAYIWYDVSLDPALINKRWVNCLCNEPVKLIVGLLKECDELLVKEQVTSYDGFKHHLQADYPMAGQLLSPIRRNITGFLTSGEGLPRIRTALRFATRANIPGFKGLESEAFDAWQELCLSPWNEVEVQRESQILQEIFPRRKCVTQVDSFLGRFGPGAAADCPPTPSLTDKYLSFSTDRMLDYAGVKVGFNPHDMPRCSDSLKRVGRLHFVPKQLDKLRTVTMEPASLMFYQLGVADCVYDLIRKSRWRRHIDIEHAEKNQDLAWLGSLTGEYATIDLSSASDCVKYQLVRSLFNKTCLRELLVSTRSRWVEYSGEIFTPTYFAPMGSGLCFPVECCVFASIVDNVMRQHGDRRAWRVYGDDIIVPSDHYSDVCERLEQLGFQVNSEKSFSGSQSFRESCGGDYFKGESVRPVYVSRFWAGLPHKSRVAPSLIESNIDLANRLFDYKLARLRVIESLAQVRPRVLFDADGESGIFSPQPTNYHAKARWNADLQRTEVLTGRISTRQEPHKLEHEDIRYFEYLRATSKRTSCEELYDISISRSLKPVWSGSWRSIYPGWDRGNSPLAKA